jgi:cell division septum initiation protein DivIVA
VALDRQSIARSDFPTARRGYEPRAVDAHLAAIADEVDELRRRAGPGAVLATQTSDQVRHILEAAEQSADGIRRGAETEGREHVARVAEAADALRARIEALEAHLTEMFATLRAGADRLTADLGEATAATAALGPAGAAVPDGVAESALGATVGSVSGAAEAEAEVDDEPALAAVEEPEPVASPDPAPGGRSQDVAGARLVAYQWALDGRSREETDRYLAEQFDVPDRAELIDQAYRAAPGG